MNLPANPETSKRILAYGFAVVILLLAGITVLALSMMGNISRNLEQVVKGHNQQIALMTTIRQAVRERSMELYAMTVSDDPFVKDEHQMQLRAKGGIYLKARGELLATDLTEQERALLNNQQAQSGITLGYQNQVLKLSNDGDDDQARRVLLEKAIPSQKEVLRLMDEFIDLQRTHNRNALDEAAQDFRYAYVIILPMAVLMVVLSWMIAAYVTRRLTVMVDYLRAAGTRLEEANQELRSEVTQRRRIAQELQHSETRERAIRENIFDAIVTIDEVGTILSCNSATSRMFGYEPEQLVGANVKMLMPASVARLHDDYLGDYLASGNASIIGIGREVDGLRADGQFISLDLGVTEVVLDGKRVFIGILHDISERKRAEAELKRARDELEVRVEQRTAELQYSNDQLHSEIAERKRVQQHLAYLANHDTLTDLPNRMAFTEQLKIAMAQARRREQQVALLFLDLDGFKRVNDTLGHEAGDVLLKMCCERLKHCVREEDLVARMGGDEFTVILGGLTDLGRVPEIAEKLIATLDEPFVVGERQCTIGVSIGVSLFPADTEDADVLLRYADDAMYRVKKMGKNNYQFYCDHPELTSNA